MFKLALAAYQNGDFTAARLHLGNFLALEPAHAEALHLSAVLSARDKRYADAEPNFLAAMRQEPKRPDFRCNYALSLHEQGRHQEAIEHFRLALGQQPGFVPALNGLGNACCALGEHQRAEEAFRQALRHDPGNPLLHNNLGNVLKESGRVSDAVASYRQSLSIDAGYAEAHVNLGIALKESGSLAEARAALGQALALRPGNRQATDNLWQIAPFWRQPVAGRHLVLRPYRESDAAFLGHCLANKNFMMHYHRFLSRGKSLATIAAHLRKAERLMPWQSGTVDWVIFRHGGAERPVGLANLVDLNCLHRRAEFLVGIPAEEERHAGVGLEASLLVLDFAFNRARLNKLTSLVYEDNPRSQKGTLGLGFQQEGYRPEHLFDANRQGYFGVYENGLTATAFRANPRLAHLSRRILGRDVTAIGEE